MDLEEILKRTDVPHDIKEGLRKNLVDRRVIQRNLEASEMKYRRLFESAKDGILILDAETGTIVDVNPFLVDLLGYSAEQFLEKKIWEIGAFKDIAANYEKFMELQQNEYVRYEDLPLETTDGRHIEVEFVSNVYLVNQRRVIQCNIRNITERKNLERALVEKERLSAIGEVASGVAHDFNNALQIILGNIELALNKKNNPPEISEYLGNIRTSANDAAARIQQLQRFAGKDGNKSEYVALNLNTILNEAIEQSRLKWKTEADQKGIVIDIQKRFGEIRTIDGNSGELKNVFYNFIKNAVEAMPGGGTLSFETGNLEEGVYVRFTDTGTGMSEETKTKIFQPFYTTKGLTLGRGLGMSVVYSIIKDHKGKVSIKKSSPGKGTTMEIIIPYGVKKPERSLETTIAEHDKPARVLWVDDEAMIRDVGKAQLEMLGYEADTASSGAEALKILETQQYDLIITDIGMPNMSGWQFAEKIKGKYKDSKVAVVTGWGADITQEEKEKYGVGYVLGKPLTMNQLKQLIDEVMQLKHR